MIQMFKTYFSVENSSRRIITAIVLTIVTAIANARVTALISIAINNASNPQVAFSYLWQLVICSLIVLICGHIYSIVYKEAHNIALTLLNDKTAKKILDADYNTFVTYGNGKIQTIVESVGSIASGGKIIMQLVNGVINFITVTVAMCIIDIKSIYIIVAVYIVGSISIKIVWAVLDATYKKAKELAKKRNEEFQKIVSGFAEVRSNCTQQKHYEVIYDYSHTSYAAYNNTAKVLAWNSTVFTIISSMLTIIGVLYALFAVPNGMAASTAMTLVIYSWSLLNPLANMLDAVDSISAATADYNQWREFMEIEPEITDGKIELSSFDSSITFDNVSFSYKESDTVLDDISFSIKKGEKIGICGTSGGGKSTILKLIPRFYDVTSGAIKIDGIDIRDFTINSLRNKIAMVHQDNYIFDGSIKENVAYGCDNVTDVEIIEACKKASIYDFIMSQEKGLETNVGPSGLKLSGGQKQRLAIARIFLQNPEIIILDEATSALDNESEEIIQDSLEYFADKTIITVAHRLSTIQDSDRIIVVNEHKIAEEGDHEKLMSIEGGIYRNLYETAEKKRLKRLNRKQSA